MIVNKLGEKSGIDVNRWIKRWPLIIFADKRIDKVIGRIKFLTVSIITIEEVKIIGAPMGTRCIIILLKDVNHPLIIKVIQIGNAIIIERVICLVGVKIYGNNPKQLNRIIEEKVEIKIIENFWFFEDKLFFISCKIFKNIFSHIIWVRDGIIQNFKGIIKKKGNIEIQLSLR